MLGSHFRPIQSGKAAPAADLWEMQPPSTAHAQSSTSDDCETERTFQLDRYGINEVQVTADIGKLDKHDKRDHCSLKELVSTALTKSLFGALV